jgi:hypothetical protein
VLAAPGRICTPLRRLLDLSLPARVAILVAVFLVICVITAFVTFYFTPNRTAWNYWIFPLRLSVIVALVIVIPLVVYKTLNLWLEGEASPFPDINYAWKAGLAALEEQGLDLAQVPLFLVLGSAGEEQEKPLFDASRLNLSVREIPQGPAAIHWYANPEGAYLVCTDTCCLSRLAKSGRDLGRGQPHEAPAPVRHLAGQTMRRTIEAIRNVVGGSVRKENLLPTESPRAEPGASGQPAVAAFPPVGGTMMIDPNAAKAFGLARAEIAAPAPETVIKLSEREVHLQTRRLEYLCHLIRRARQPLCPINGILTLLPFHLIERGDAAAGEIQQAVARDLGVLSSGLMVRCPATVMVTGLEEDSGFRELVRRVGHETAQWNRFGKGFASNRKGSHVWSWNAPTAERLEALAAHACGAFEDWVYTLFSEESALSKPGNILLFALLCKIRSRVQHRLAKILVGGYGVAQEQPAANEGFLFSGCYFAATGETEDRQAFVKGVFDKLPEEQNALEWAETAYREEQRYQLLAQWGLTLDTGLLLGIVAMVVYKWFRFW